MPTATKTDPVLAKLAKGPTTLQQLGCTRHQLRRLLDDKLIKRAGEAKNPGSRARKAVLYNLTAKGRKKAGG